MAGRWWWWATLRGELGWPGTSFYLEGLERRGHEQDSRGPIGGLGFVFTKYSLISPKHLKLIRWTRAFKSLSQLESHPCQG